MQATVVPKTYLIGYTQIDAPSLHNYLEDTEQDGFRDTMSEFVKSRTCHDVLNDCISLISFYAKMCYKSLVPGKNSNISKTRDVESNFESIISSGHGSVLEHVTFNFVTTNCSRVFTHELVRHRVGTAFSQTSGRYVRLDDVQVVLPPELEMHRDVVESFLLDLQGTVYELECRVGLQGPEAAWEYHRENDYLPGIREDDPAKSHYLESLGFVLARDSENVGDDQWVLPFDVKKRLTSAIRRIAPNGQTNEIGWSCNLRSLRHVIEMRTSRHAEWEIRHVFNEVASIIEERCPLMLYGGKKSEPDPTYGLCEWTGLRV